MIVRSCLFFLLAEVLMPVPIEACVIQGYDSGICMQPTQDVILEMPFCGKVIDYPVCIPKYQGGVVPRWRNHTLRNKDKWVEETFNKEWDIRKTIELDESMRGSGIDEYGMEGKVVERFYGGDEADSNQDPWLFMNDCAKAYKNFFCWANFPRCDEEGNSLMLCKSVCENYFKSCGYKKDLWRCGEPKYFNGYDAEEPLDDIDGYPTVFMRSFFPGQPFRNNEFEEDKETPIAVCTPSQKGTTNRLWSSWHQRMAALFLCAALVHINRFE